MIPEPCRSKPLSVVSLSLISKYLWAILGTCLCVAGHPLVHEPVDSGQHKGDLGFLMYLDQPGVAGDNMIDMQIEGNFISLPHTGEPRQCVWELHFTARLVANCGLILL